MPGPLPDPRSRRRNAPTIPTTNLPADGRTGPVPRPPSSYKLGPAGRAWWKWAWKLPQAAGWSKGDLYAVARRGQLEDEMAALAKVDGGGIAELLHVADAKEFEDQFGWLLRSLKSSAAGSTNLMREMRELDDRLGLTPKGMATLRWTIVAPKEEQVQPPKRPAAKKARHLRAVDPTLIGAG